MTCINIALLTRGILWRQVCRRRALSPGDRGECTAPFFIGDSRAERRRLAGPCASVMFLLVDPVQMTFVFHRLRG